MFVRKAYDHQKTHRHHLQQQQQQQQQQQRQQQQQQQQLGTTSVRIFGLDGRGYCATHYEKGARFINFALS